MPLDMTVPDALTDLQTEVMGTNLFPHTMESRFHSLGNSGCHCSPFFHSTGKLLLGQRYSKQIAA